MILASVAGAQDIARSTPPQTWIEPFLPEDLPALVHPAYASALERARTEVFTGRYKKALQSLWSLGDAGAGEVALLKAQALAATGHSAAALKLLSSDDPRAVLLRSEILCDQGKPREALDLIEAMLLKHPNSIAGRFELGRIHEQLGDLDKARAAYGWFVADPQDFLKRWQSGREKQFEDAAEVVLIGRALDRWAALTGAYETLPELHDTLLNMFVRAYDVIDRAYWPAHVAAAEYFLSHDNATQAKLELKDALATNPNDAHSWALLAQIAVSEYNFDGADAAIAQIREVNPQSTAAELLDARNLLQQRRPGDAQASLERVLVEQPDNIEALGLIAAAHALQLKDADCQAALKKVEALDPDNAAAYLEVAQQLAAMRQYPRSAAMYKVAIDRAPWWTAARNGLGLLYTQSGDEDLARTVLDAAHHLDPFNLQTTNYLRLLDDLQKFARRETPHFVVMYDESADPIIGEYFSEYLEGIYGEVAAAYAHEPAIKTLIEVFPTHDAFSVRTTGSPWIGTVGASTGRVIALVSPRKGEMTMGPFNWAQVLRHEFTHTVTLSATDNRIPHWMTEGLAVLEEDVPMRWEWVPMLYRAVTKDELFTMENLTWGFVRPKRPTDRSLAYAQSFWICKYIDEKYGRDAILAMMREFRGGAAQEEVFPKILGQSLSEFTQAFNAWAKAQVATWGYDEETSKRYEELRDRGEELVKARDYAEAVKVWEQIARLRPVDALPHQRLAGLYLSKQMNDPEKAIEQLKILHNVELHDNRYAKRIARVCRDTGRLDEAQHSALAAVYIDPYDLDAHQLVAEIAEKAGNQAILQRERRMIPALEKWLADYRSQSQIDPPKD